MTLGEVERQGPAAAAAWFVSPFPGGGRDLCCFSGVGEFQMGATPGVPGANDHATACDGGVDWSMH